jgi:Flp pilus assembly protein TadD
MRFVPLELRLCVALAAATLAAFWPVLGHDFVNYDDPDYVIQNPEVRAGLSGPGVRWAFTTFHAANWHPLTWLSLQLDATLWRPDSSAVRLAGRLLRLPGEPLTPEQLLARGCHLTNLLLHTANAVLLLLVLKQMTGALWRSALVAALFALHPLHVESVAWVAERKDVLSTFFWILTLGAYGWYIRRPGPLRYAAVTAAFVLGLLAKPMLVTLPCVLLLLDYWPLQRAWSVERGAWSVPNGSWDLRFTLHAPRSTLLEKVPLLLLALASCAVTAFAQREAGAVRDLGMYTLRLRLFNALVSYVGYLGQTVWPRDLAAFYPFSLRRAGTLPAAGAVLLLGLVTAACLLQARRRPYLAVGWLWYLGTLVPVIGLVQVGDQAHADRYSYVPLIGIFVMLAWGLADLAQSQPHLRRLIGVTAGVLPVLCLIGTREQVAFWSGSEPLWEHALAVTTNNAIAHDNLGNALKARGDLEGAEEHLREALRLQPGVVDTRHNLGTVLARQGRRDEAITCFEAVLADDRTPPLTRAWSHHGLAQCLISRGETEKAAEHLRRARDLQPDEGRYLFGLGSLLEGCGSLDEARSQYEAGLTLSPDWPRQAQRYAWALATAAEPNPGDTALALFFARQACHGEAASDATALHTLAVAQAACGRYGEARATARRAQEAATAQGLPQLADQIAERLLQWRDYP